MSRIFHPLLYMLASATRQELARQVNYLKTENQILRSKLPKRVPVTSTERRQLVKAARGIGDALRSLVAIVQPGTLLRWLNTDETPRSNKKPSTRKPGRPRTLPVDNSLRTKLSDDSLNPIRGGREIVAAPRLSGDRSLAG